MVGKKTEMDAEISDENFNSPAPEKKVDYMAKMRANPWIISTAVLGIVLIIVLIFSVGGGVTGSVVNKADAGQNLIDFIKARGTTDVEIMSVEKDGTLYRAIVDVQGQSTPVYITLDGKYAITQIIPLIMEEETATATPTEVSKSDKPNVELFVMSHCPYGTQIEKGIIPVVELLGNKIDFEIKFVDYAMHGETEIKEELNQYCIQKEQNDKYFDYLKCFLEDGDGERCLGAAKINAASLKTCADKADKEFGIMDDFNDKTTWASGSYPPFAVHEEENAQYGVQGSPTLVINGAQANSGRDSASLLNTICSAFNDAPEECSQTLSSASPSAGFGYSASDSGSTDAQCG